MASPNTTPVQVDIRKQREQHLRISIKETLMRFKFTHLMSDVIVNLFELQITEVSSKLSKLKLPCNKHSIADLLFHRAKAFEVEELQDIHFYLQLYRTAVFSKLKRWTPVNLLEPDASCKSSADEETIRLSILQAFRIKGLNAVVKVISHDGMIWLMIISKKLTRKKGVKLQTPIFMCYEVGFPYIFVASQIPDTVMQCILKAMRYKKHKLQHLVGKDIKSLLTILKHKSTHTQSMVPVVYEPAEAIVGRRNIDFTKSRARSLYAEKVFQIKDAICLETFTVKADSTWRENELLPEMVGEPIVAVMQLSSKNVFDMMKSMLETDMMTTPIPKYVQTILHAGKNNINMRVARRHNVTM